MKSRLILMTIILMGIMACDQTSTDISTLDGVTSKMVTTERLKTHVLLSGPKKGIPVVFLHGNFSAATYWEETMLALPKEYRAIAPDLRGYGHTEDKPIDATKGTADWSEDLDALLAKLKIKKAHFVGWSLGCGVLYQYIIDHPEKVLSASLVSPVSPYGWGGTKDSEGTPNYEDFSGTGAGGVNPEFVRRVKMGDRTTEDPNSPQSVINAFYYKPPFHASREEDFLSASLMQKTGDDRYPGDFLPSENWPNVAPGKWGPLNALSPKYIGALAQNLIHVNPKPPILWVRGSHDLIVSDNSLFDFGTLGSLGYVPGWPGMDINPPQPMVSQTREVLKKYAAENGFFKEEMIQETAHGPQIEKPDEFNKIFHAFLKNN